MEQELLHKSSHILKVTHYRCGLPLLTLSFGSWQSVWTDPLLHIASFFPYVGYWLRFFFGILLLFIRPLLNFWIVLLFRCSAYTCIFGDDPSAPFSGFCVFNGCRTILAFLAGGVCPREDIWITFAVYCLDTRRVYETARTQPICMPSSRVKARCQEILTAGRARLCETMGAGKPTFPKRGGP